MITKEEFYLPSSDGESKIHGLQWLPEGKPEAVFQIVHGMIEYIDRYDEFAEYLSTRHIAVVGHDHLGHGKTSKEEDFGHFSDCNGDKYILKDMQRVSRYCKKKFSGLPHFILGHSMGSFFLRKYLTAYSDSFAGVILIGTGDQSLLTLAAGITVISAVSFLHGARYRSKLLHTLVLGNFNRAFKPVTTSSDWLTRDSAAAYAYSTDPYCSFYFSCGAYCDFFRTMLSLKFRKNLHCGPEKLSVLLLSGSRDPVGQRGAGVKRIYRSMRRAGVKDISIKLYPDARHEILKEINKQEVFHDIVFWLSGRMGEVRRAR